MILEVVMGWTLLILVLASSVLCVVPLCAAIDAAIKPESAWQAANQNKLVWVLLLGGSVFLSCLGLITVLIYFLKIRPKVVANIHESGELNKRRLG